MTIYKPLIIVVPEDVHERLARNADEIEREWTDDEAHATEMQDIRALCAKNGWTFEMLAIGAWLTKKFDASIAGMPAR